MKQAEPEEILAALRTLQTREVIENLLMSDAKTAYIADARAGRVMTIQRDALKGWHVHVNQSRGDARQDKILVETYRQTADGVLNALAKGGIY